MKNTDFKRVDKNNSINIGIIQKQNEMVSIPAKNTETKADLGKFKGVGKEIITFKKQNVVRVKIQSCIVNTTKIVDQKTKESKEVQQFSMKVIDLTDNKEKDFNIVSKRLMEKLSILNDSVGLIGNSFRIEKIGTSFDTSFDVSQIQ